MNFDTIENILTLELKKKLPGLKSQSKMIAKGRGDFLSLKKLERTKKSAVLVLLYKENKQVFIVFIKRAEDGGSHSGQIAFPGGKVEKFDKNFIETALRETEEEIGVSKKPIKVLGKLTSLFIPVSNYDVQPIVGILNKKPKFKRNISEVAEIYCVNLIDLINAKVINKTFKIHNIEISAPFYILNKIEIWGATAMVVSEFIEIISKINGKKQA